MFGGLGGGAPPLKWARGTARDVDPQWSRGKVRKWKNWATKNTDMFDYRSGAEVQPAFDGNDSQGVDIGIRALLYDLNVRGYHTEGSNLASAGSDGVWQPFVVLAADPPPGVYDELDRRAPRGYYAYSGQEAYKRKGVFNVGYAHESCGDPANINTCSHSPSPEERLRVDRAFVEAVRAVI